MNYKNRKALFSLSQSQSQLEPYPLEEDSTGYVFVTDAGVRYNLYFSEGKYYLSDVAQIPFADYILMFGIKPLQEPVSSADPRIKVTVIYLLELLFNSEPQTVIIYVCDQSDERQKTRGRMFSRWFSSYRKGFVKRNYESEDQRLFAYAIFREDHPFKPQVEALVEQFILSKES
jgi:hypothetical protein